MLLELGLLGGAAGLFAARNTKPVKGVLGFFKRMIIKSKTGQSLILANSKDSIKNEFTAEIDKLKEDSVDINLDKKSLAKKEDYLKFLTFALEDETVSQEEKETYRKEYDLKRAEIEVLRESIIQKEVLIEERSKALKTYEEHVLEKRLVEAELAEVLFHQENKVNELKKKLDNVEMLGDNTMTNRVIERFSGGSVGSNIPIGRRYELMERFKKKGN